MFEMCLLPRFNETDALGHISNTVMPTWFEDGRKPIIKLIHPNLTREDWPIIVAHIDIDFIRQIFLDYEVTIKSKVGEIGNSSIAVHQEAWQQNKLVASGKCILVYFDYKIQKKAKVPETIRKKLLEF